MGLEPADDSEPRPRPNSPIHDGVGALTAAVDVQGDRLEAHVTGWGAGEESWAIDFRRFDGDPEGEQVWFDLDAYLLKRWKHEMELHGYDWRNPPIDDPKACHCAKGIGSMRKQTPYMEHGKSWYGWDNFYSRRRVRHQEHREILLELKEWG